MTDPKRLMHEANDFETELLSAGRRDAMPERSGRTILAALGLVPSFAAAGAAATTGKIALLKGALAIAGIGATGALALWGGQHWSSTPTQAPGPAAPQVQMQAPAPAAPPPPVIDKNEPVVAPEAAPQKAPKQPMRAAPSTAAPRADSLPLELDAIEKARNALSRGNQALALRLLDRYSARFPKPRLGAEAAVLRIEALVARGDRESATRLGKAFLKSNPKSPYARRVRSLLGQAAGASRVSHPSLGR